ncbi:MAG TPA: glycogen/starch synthase, partial [Bacillota bacterium]|nr:glycogen/starch synthase [Bacillota bacterium]
MRVLMVSWEYPPKIVGGLGRHVEGLSEALVRAG